MAIATLLIFATIIATIIMGDVTDDVIISIMLFVKCSIHEKSPFRIYYKELEEEL